MTGWLAEWLKVTLGLVWMDELDEDGGSESRWVVEWQSKPNKASNGIQTRKNAQKCQVFLLFSNLPGFEKKSTQKFNACHSIIIKMEIRNKNNDDDDGLIVWVNGDALDNFMACFMFNLDSHTLKKINSSR